MNFKALFKHVISLCLLVFFNVANSAEKITVVFGESLAPWVLEDSNSGIIIELIEAALAPLGYEITPVYLPYARRSKAYLDGDVDVVSDMNPNTISATGLEGYFSDFAYSYENFAFSLHKNQFQFVQLSDLENHSLLSWQNATVHLGEEYAQMAANNPGYGETFDQENQVKMLFLERYDVIQMDSLIFDYYRAKITDDKIDTNQKVDRFALFGASPNGFLFKSEKLRDQFNQQLEWLKSTGEYQQIFKRYR